MISKVLQRQNTILQCSVSCLESLSCAATGIQIQLPSDLWGHRTGRELRQHLQEHVDHQKARPLPKPATNRGKQRGCSPLKYRWPS